MKPRGRYCLVALAAGLSPNLWAADSLCIEPQEQQRLNATYADLNEKYGLQQLSRQFLDLIGISEDLKEQLKSCRQDATGADPERCLPLEKQYDTRHAEQETLAQRFYTALDMQEYLSTLKLKLERPLCTK